MARLILLKELTEAPSYTEVFREALRLYEDLIKRNEKGQKLYVRDENGILSEYPIFGA